MSSFTELSIMKSMLLLNPEIKKVRVSPHQFTKYEIYHIEDFFKSNIAFYSSDYVEDGKFQFASTYNNYGEIDWSPLISLDDFASENIKKYLALKAFW